MIVHDTKFMRTVASRGDIGFAEVFMDEKFDTPDLATLLEYFSTNWDDAGKLVTGGWIAQFLVNLQHGGGRTPRKGRSATSWRTTIWAMISTQRGSTRR